MDYQQAIEHLLALVDHERTQPLGPRQKRIYDLGRMEALLERLGHPQRAARTVHVAGTKGKGSVAAMCDAVLHAAGYSTGFYSSPHLHSFRERIRRDGQPVTEDKFSGLVERLWPYQQWVGENAGLGQVSLFEFMTGMAFQCFKEDGVAFQTMEVGLGGRLDATNVVDPAVCVITPVSLDHMAVLGDTIPEIAAEKAGIIKEGVPVVIALQPQEALDVILSICRERNAPPVLVGRDVTWQGGAADLTGQDALVRGRLGEYRLRIPLLGEHQLANAATAVAALEALREAGYAISADALAGGLAGVSWPCRLEVLKSGDYLLVADGAHNDQSVMVMLESLSRYFDYRRLLLVAGFSRDKNVVPMVDLLAASRPAMVVAARSRHPRSLPPATIAEEFRKRGVDSMEAGTAAEAVELACSLAQPGDLVLGTGSLFVAAEVREAVLGIAPELYPDLLPIDLRDSAPDHRR